MTLQVAKIPRYLVNDLMKRGYTEQSIATLSPAEAFREYCEWHGLINWSDTLIKAIDDLRGAAKERT